MSSPSIPRGPLDGFISALARVNPVVWLLILLLIAIVIISPNFLQPFGYMNFIRRAAPIAILAAGQVFVLTSGGFDLSQGALVTLTVIASSILLGGNEEMVWAVIAAMLAGGVLVGVINGLVVSYLKVPSIIATLGMMISLGGIALTWSGGSPRGYLPESFRFFGRYIIKDVPLVTILPIAVIVMIVVCAAFWWAMHRTNLGKMVHALGDNPTSARLSGVPVVRVRVAAFVLSSVSAVIAGIMLGGFAGVSTDVGLGLELQSITAAVLGGTRLLGGFGTVGGAVAGALALQALFTLLNFLGLPKPLRDVAQGLILIFAVALAAHRRRRSGIN
ncbi:MAG: ABC transporter permease [Pseudomonadota bacterium]